MVKTYKNKYFEFTPEWSGFDIKYHIAGYFDEYAMLQIYFIWGKLFIYLPWRHYKIIKRKKTLKELRKDKLQKFSNPKFKPKEIYEKKYYNQYDPPVYGLYFHHNDQLGVCTGDVNLYDLPWTSDWIRTSALTKDGKWLHENKKNRNQDFWDTNKWKDILYYETHSYKYTTKHGEIQNCMATIRVEEREWRWKWFKWLKWTRKIKRNIEVEFSEDVGEQKGSWKGGCVGCSYKMLKNETPYECLKRMERERIFN
jgi:hypothetical protein